MGDLLPAAAAQLHLDAAHPLRAPGVRHALPAHRCQARPGGRGIMKVQGWLFLACGVFFAGVDIAYWFWTKSAMGHGEPVGTTAMAISVGFAFMVGYYLMFTARRIGRQPEDDKQAD